MTIDYILQRLIAILLAHVIYENVSLPSSYAEIMMLRKELFKTFFE